MHQKSQKQCRKYREQLLQERRQRAVQEEVIQRVFQKIDLIGTGRDQRDIKIRRISSSGQDDRMIDDARRQKADCRHHHAHERTVAADQDETKEKEDQIGIKQA